MTADDDTAAAFAESWNRIGTVYTLDQFLDWIAPLEPQDLRGKEVLELGFGNGSLLYYAARCFPSRLTGVDLGDTLEQARRLLADAPVQPELIRGDLTQANAGSFDVVYCIGVLHHLQSPEAGFASVLRHTKRGGRFHCWVYAHEGNGLIRYAVDPIRRVASRLPWWLTKYAIAFPLVLPFFLYARLMRLAGFPQALRLLPLFDYTRWIAGERFRMFHHVAFDQLVTPSTQYIERSRVDAWLRDPQIEQGSTYVVFRNGNSWKFGGRKT